MWAITAPRSDSAASHRFLSIALSRSALSLTCEADSSPLIYNERIPCFAVSAATVNKSVDLPTPGSPAKRIAAPGTKPPPKTLSNSPTPLDLALALAKSTSPIGFAGVVNDPATSESFLGAAISSTLPHAWHSPHLPTHFVALQPHSTQRNGSFAGAFAMAII